MTGLRASGSRTRLLAAAAMVVSGTLLAGVPGAAAHPGDTAIQLAPAEAEAGSTVTVSGEGFTAGTDVAVELRTAEGDVPLVSATVDDEGHFSAPVELGKSLGTRYYEVQAVGTAETATQLLSVSALPDGAAADLLGGSGLPVLPLALACGLGVLVVVVVRVVLVVIVRRRTPVADAGR